MTDRLDSLDAIHQACWQQLRDAALDKLHGWRLMALATVGASADDGPQAELRTVVLREVDVAARQLLFFTDARSPKAAQLAQQPRAALLLWCARLGWQLRLRVSVEVQTSGLAVSSRWAKVKLSPAAQDYLSPLPPGAPLRGHQPERASRDHFAVCTAQVEAIDWLELHPQGQRRALFDGAGQGRWVTP